MIHHDDLGASHGANMAFVELAEKGLVTSGSVMVPGPWFPELARLARDRPELDVGVHLTLTAEFAPFRWRPLSGVSGAGLTDPAGYFWPDVARARRADPAAVERELRLQIDAALDAGIDVTHLDSHMGTVWQPELFDVYLRLGADYRLPIMLARTLDGMGADSETLAAAIEGLEARANPIFETFVTTPFGRPVADAAEYRGILENVRPGLNWGAFHFARPGDMEFISDDAALRITEYELFANGPIRAMLSELGIVPIGMRAFRDAMRA